MAILTGVTGLVLWRQFDRRADDHAWEELVGASPAAPETFDPSVLSELPEPARVWAAEVQILTQNFAFAAQSPAGGKQFRWFRIGTVREYRFANHPVQVHRWKGKDP